MKNEWKKCFQIGATLFLLFLCIYYWQPSVRIAGAALKAATPLLLGCVAAYIVNILMAFYQRHYFPNSKKPFGQKRARPVCITGAFLTLICIAVLVIQLIVPELTACIQLLLAEVPKAAKSIWDQIAQLGVLPAGIVQSLNSLDWNATLNNLLTLLKTGLGSTVQFAVGAVSGAASWLMNLVIGTIFAIYLLIDKERLQAQCLRVLARICRPAHLEKLRDVLSVVNRCFHRYIVGQCAEAVILGVLCMLGMFLFRFPYAVMTGTVIGVTALIPVAGAYIGGAVGFLLILSVSPLKAVLFIVYLIVLQQVEGNLIFPKVVGSSIGLPAIWVLAAVTVGGGLFGIPGMLLGVPLAAALYQLLRSAVNQNTQRSPSPQAPA
jgi:predicted PurR-regulated permease PerM